MIQERLDHFIGLLFAFKLENMEELWSPSSLYFKKHKSKKKEKRNNEKVTRKTITFTDKTMWQK